MEFWLISKMGHNIHITWTVEVKPCLFKDVHLLHEQSNNMM